MSNGNNDLPPKLRGTFAELEYELWEAVVDRSIGPDFQYEFGFTVDRNIDGVNVKESILVTVSMRKCP
jgi:hypothetical protein